LREDIRIKKIAFNLKTCEKFIEIEVPGDEILQSVAAESPDFEKQVKQKVIDYIRAL
jgi:hypothetical protein